MIRVRALRRDCRIDVCFPCFGHSSKQFYQLLTDEGPLGGAVAVLELRLRFHDDATSLIKHLTAVSRPPKPTQPLPKPKPSGAKQPSGGGKAGGGPNTSSTPGGSGAGGKAGGR